MLGYVICYVISELLQTTDTMFKILAAWKCFVALYCQSVLIQDYKSWYTKSMRFSKPWCLFWNLIWLLKGNKLSYTLLVLYLSEAVPVVPPGAHQVLGRLWRSERAATGRQHKQLVTVVAHSPPWVGPRRAPAAEPAARRQSRGCTFHSQTPSHITVKFLCAYTCARSWYYYKLWNVANLLLRKRVENTNTSLFCIVSYGVLIHAVRL